ncbi:MAG: hypothetical protein JXM70_12160 [Pirellulales bacterium]|nr:hypothetical protein [Pirellulales bacterium]
MKKMIARLVRGISLLGLCFVVGTLIAQSMIFAYVWKSWDMSGDKITQMMAIARGREMVAVARDELRRQEEIAPEQPSFEEIIEVRAGKNRNMELREQALSQDVTELRAQQNKQNREFASFKETRGAFEKKLTELKEFQESNGLQENIVILQNMKPEQAKDQLIKIYDSGQIDQAVMLVAGMEAMKLKKITGVFTTEEDQKILADILRRIRLGTPVALLAEQTLEELENKKKSED